MWSEVKGTGINARLTQRRNDAKVSNGKGPKGCRLPQPEFQGRDPGRWATSMQHVVESVEKAEKAEKAMKSLGFSQLSQSSRR